MWSTSAFAYLLHSFIRTLCTCTNTCFVLVRIPFVTQGPPTCFTIPCAIGTVALPHSGIMSTIDTNGDITDRLILIVKSGKILYFLYKSNGASKSIWQYFCASWDNVPSFDAKQVPTLTCFGFLRRRWLFLHNAWRVVFPLPFFYNTTIYRHNSYVIHFVVNVIFWQIEDGVLFPQHGVITFVVTSCNGCEVQWKNSFRFLTNDPKMWSIATEVVQFKQDCVVCNVRSQLHNVNLSASFFLSMCTSFERHYPFCCILDWL